MSEKAKVLETARKMLRPDLTPQQFAHIVLANPETHGFTSAAFKAESMVVFLMERVMVAEEALKRELRAHRCPNTVDDVLDAVNADLFGGRLMPVKWVESHGLEDEGE